MTQYYCIVCRTIYDVEEGMPIRCCNKILRHQINEV